MQLGTNLPLSQARLNFVKIHHFVYKLIRSSILWKRFGKIHSILCCWSVQVQAIWCGQIKSRKSIRSRTLYNCGGLCKRNKFIQSSRTNQRKSVKSIIRVDKRSYRLVWSNLNIVWRSITHTISCGVHSIIHQVASTQQDHLVSYIICTHQLVAFNHLAWLYQNIEGRFQGHWHPQVK